MASSSVKINPEASSSSAVGHNVDESFSMTFPIRCFLPFYLMSTIISTTLLAKTKTAKTKKIASVKKITSTRFADLTLLC